MDIQPNFNMGSLEARLSDKVINEAIDEMKQERTVTKEAAGPSGSEPGNGNEEGV